MNTNFKLEGTEKIKIYPSKVSEKPLVSVCIQTYKHEKYIKQCLDGILMQQTNFEFEILLGEDDSPDKTREICIEYAKKHPKIIRLFLHDRSNVIYIKGNQTGRYNFIYNLTNSNGKYIALCEGDDYWTDPLKLQKQVDFLETNSDFSLTFGNSKILDETGCYHKKGDALKSNIPNIYKPEEVVLLGITPLTILFRNTIKLPDWFSNAMSGDYFLCLILSKYGKFYYHGELFGVRRKHANGVSILHNRLDWNLNNALHLKKFLPESILEQKPLIAKKITTYKIYALFFSLSQKDFFLTLNLFFDMILYKGFYSRLGLGLFKMLFREVILKKNMNPLIDMF